MTPAVPHVLHVFATFVPAGPQVRTVKLFDGLAGRFRHSVLAMDGRDDARELIGENVTATMLPAPPKDSTLRTVPRLARVLRDVRPDLLCTYNWGALDAVLAARLCRFGHVIHHEDGFRPDEAHARKRRRNWARRLAFSGVRTVVVISETLERIAREEWHLGPQRLQFIPNGIEVERFAAPTESPHRRELGLEEAFVIGAVGHLRPEKNLVRLLHALAGLPRERNAHAVILGEGPERERLDELTRTLDLESRVHFVGYHADPRAWYRTFDAFAITSDTEQAPISLLEAMASGVPVVATDVGDVRAMLPEMARCGVVPAGSEEDVRAGLSARFLELCTQPELRTARAEAGRKRVRARFDAARMVATYEDLWRRAIGPRERP